MREYPPDWKKHIAVSRARDSGSDFLRAYFTLIEHNQKIEEMPPPCHGVIMAAHVMNLPFAIELFFKALLLSEEKEPWGHKLRKLYEALSPQLQNKIFEVFLLSRPHYTHEMFLEMLEVHTDAFTEWRYIHEEGFGQMNVDFCESLAQGLEILANEISSNLQKNLTNFC